MQSLILHTPKSFSIFATWLLKACSSSSFLLQEKCIPRILTVSSFKLIHCMLQSATLTPFGAPIPAILRFDLFGFRPAFFENLSKTFKIYIYITCLVFNKESGANSLCTIQKIMFKCYLFKCQCFDLISSLQIQLLTLKWISKEILDLFGVHLFLI